MVFGIDVVLLQEEEVEVQGDSLGEDKVHVITSIRFPSFSLSMDSGWTLFSIADY